MTKGSARLATAPSSPGIRRTTLRLRGLTVRLNPQPRAIKIAKHHRNIPLTVASSYNPGALAAHAGICNHLGGHFNQVNAIASDPHGHRANRLFRGSCLRILAIANRVPCTILQPSLKPIKVQVNDGRCVKRQ
jgi:hypothetical protein